MQLKTLELQEDDPAYPASKVPLKLCAFSQIYEDQEYPHSADGKALTIGVSHEAKPEGSCRSPRR